MKITTNITSLTSMMRYIIIVLIAINMYSCQGTKDGMVTISQDSLDILIQKAQKYDDSEETEKKYKTFLEVTEEQKKHMQELEDSLLNNGNDTRILELVITEANSRMGAMKAICDDYKNETAIHIKELRNNTENEMRKWSGFYAYVLNQATNLNLTRDSLKYFKDKDTVYIGARKEIEAKQREIDALTNKIKNLNNIIDDLNDDIAQQKVDLDKIIQDTTGYHKPKILINRVSIKSKKSTEIIVSYTVFWEMYDSEVMELFFRVYPAKEFKNDKNKKKTISYSESYLIYGKVEGFEYSSRATISGAKNTDQTLEFECSKNKGDNCIAGPYLVEVYLNKDFTKPFTKITQNVVLPKK